MDHKLLESYIALFAPGETLVQLEFEFLSGGVDRARLVKRAGLLLLEESTTLGFRRGFLHSMASVAEMCRVVLQREAEWQTSQDGRITRNEKAERLMPYLCAVGTVQAVDEA